MPGDVAIDEALAQRLPLPLAKLYRRAHEAASALERHLIAFYLWEASLKLLATVAVVEYAALDVPDPAIAERLRNLARPSFGHWREFVRLLLPVLASRGDAPFVKLHGLLEGSSRDDLRAAAGLDALLLQDLERKSGARAVVRLPDLLNRLVTYRNYRIAHGAVGLGDKAFSERMGGALLQGAAEFLWRIDPLAGRQLVYMKDVRLADGFCRVERLELIGERGRAMETLELPREAADRMRPDGNRVYLEGPAGRRPLQPLLVYDAETRELLFLNSRRGQRGAQYLCYTNNRTEDRSDLRGEQCRLLAEVLRLPTVDSGQAAAWAAQAEADEAAQAEAEESPVPSVPAQNCLGDFELVNEVARGGMGIVYRAWQPTLRRQVAVKEMIRQGDPRTWAKLQARFRREVRALGRVKHPHLIDIYTEGKEGDRWFYVMELVEGPSLARVCEQLTEEAGDPSAVTWDAWQGAVSTAYDHGAGKGVPLGGAESVAPAAPPETPVAVTVPSEGRGFVWRAAELMRQVAEAAHALHEAGIVHRDIKPGNILLRAGGTEAVLMDLGVAQWADGEVVTTSHDKILGTLRYASPEQVVKLGSVDGAATSIPSGRPCGKC